MTEIELKKRIETAILQFQDLPLYEAGMNLLAALGYQSNLQLRVSGFDEFKHNLDQAGKLNEDHAKVNDWQNVEFLCQVTGDTLNASGQGGLGFQTDYQPTDMQSYLFLAIELKGLEYTRTELAKITRAVNQVFLIPTLLIFKHGKSLTLAIIDRRTSKKDESKDVLELQKVTLIKDISCASPHRAHIEILFDLSLSELHAHNTCTNFKQLQTAWQKTLDTKELNKLFYKDLSNWYFWALGQVRFPKDAPKDADGRDSISLIRLITRLIFCWFLKEKNLIPEALFREEKVKALMNDLTPGESSYYKAILQNLFFATLNQEMGKDNDGQLKRRFRKDGQNFMVQTLYRYRKLFRDPEAMLSLFHDIPFMNGGLFECLDKNIGTKENPVYQRIDGFSDRTDNPLSIPNDLFFGQVRTVDLSVTYGDNKRRAEKVQGLIKILEKYKFTVTENTPIEEEIALDPELLGKVFENLLAAYNPETGATARKQTGSYYTPREIVNYMVDESLKAYLKQKLETEAGMKPEDADIGLEFLIGYYDKENLFDGRQTEVLINAIDNCKVLDPACGSGAFPMGILLKMVHILDKLDRKNIEWKARQIANAEMMTDVEARSSSIAKIEEAFEHHHLDYGRKLFLIQNGIYGIDIQPIAVQIAKLRCFISLLVDQKIDRSDDNFGIIPLPNLETKFVAANSLIGIERPKKGDQGALRNPEIEAKEELLRQVRDRHFNARTPDTKAKYRAEDARLRAEIAKLLIDDDLEPKTAHMLANWDPYDQNASAPFFDPEWMFGRLTKPRAASTMRGTLSLVNNAAGQMEFGAPESEPISFDVVIGNPPYGAEFSVEHVKYFKNLYDSAKTIKGTQKGSLDSFSLFTDAGLNFANNKSILSFIVPMAITSSEAITALHNKIFRTCETTYFSTYSNRPQRVFESADQRVAIIILLKNNNPLRKLYTTKVNKRYINTSVQDVIDNLKYVNSSTVLTFSRVKTIV